MIAEPAVNLIHGDGFEVRFSEILAMYSFLLVPWMKVFGVSLRSIRGANMTCATLGLFMLWLAVKRLGLIQRASFRLLLVLLLAAEFGMIFAYRTGRYDGFGCLLMAVLIFAISLHDRRRRWLALFIVCLFLPWAGPQYLIALFSAGVVLGLIFRRRYLMEVGVSFLGVGLGQFAFLAVVALTGRLSSYRDFLHIQQRSGVFIRGLMHGTLIHHNFLPKDFSFPFLLAASLVLLVALRRLKRGPQYTSLCFSLLYCAVVTVLFVSIAKFPSYYSYLIAIPLAISTVAGLSVCETKAARYAVVACCFMSVAAGAGMNTAAYAEDSQDHDYARLQEFVRQSVRANDVAYVDPEIYLLARQRAADAYFPNPDLDILPRMSTEQKESITVLVIQPSWIDDTTRELGGEWKATGQELVPAGHNVFGDNDKGFISWTLKDLKVLRRTQ